MLIWLSFRCPQNHALASVIVHEFDARRFQGAQNLLDGRRVPANLSTVAFHALHRRNVDTGAFGKLAGRPAGFTQEQMFGLSPIQQLSNVPQSGVVQRIAVGKTGNEGAAIGS